MREAELWDEKLLAGSGMRVSISDFSLVGRGSRTQEMTSWSYVFMVQIQIQIQIHKFKIKRKCNCEFKPFFRDVL